MNPLLELAIQEEETALAELNALTHKSSRRSWQRATYRRFLAHMNSLCHERKEGRLLFATEKQGEDYMTAHPTFTFTHLTKTNAHLSYKRESESDLEIAKNNYPVVFWDIGVKID